MTLSLHLSGIRVYNLHGAVGFARPGIPQSRTSVFKDKTVEGPVVEQTAESGHIATLDGGEARVQKDFLDKPLLDVQLFADSEM